MDFVVRIWEKDKKLTVNRYVGSEFLGHNTAVDILSHFKKGTEELDPRKLLHVSMDGPNVNHKFFKDLNAERASAGYPDLLNVGTCSLHTVHGSLKCTTIDWKIENILRSLWQVFHESPARREDFVRETGSSIFPLSFCATRWVEDVKVAERAVFIWSNVKLYIEFLSQHPKKEPKSPSYLTLKAA